MSGVARRKQAQRKVDTARGVLSGLVRTAKLSPPVTLAAQIARHKAVLAAWRSLGHAYGEAATCYRPDSPTQQAMLDAQIGANTVSAHLQLQLDAAGGA